MSYAAAATLPIHTEALLDERVSPWDVFERPHKAVKDYSTLELGREGERLAYVYLARKGYDMHALNWTSTAGEVDIVCADEGEIVLVEVKTARDLDRSACCVPELSVTKNKQRKYRRLAQSYLMTHPACTRVRFDVIAVTILDQRLASLRHLVGAFWGDES